MAHRFMLLALSFVVQGVAWSAPAKDNPKCEPNPVFSRFPGEVMDQCLRSPFKVLKLWKAESAADLENLSAEYSVEGEYWEYDNPLTKAGGGRLPGKLEVRRNFENAIKAANGKVLGLNGQHTVYYTVKRPDGEYHGIAACGRAGDDGCELVTHKMVRVAGMKQSVVVTADQIAKGVADEGKAVFYGLYFDTDKAVLKPESAPTLVEMAKWLNSNPKSQVFIVGHTDMQGSVAHNLQLSKARGAAVVQALVKQHGIKADRLTGEGVGPFAPISNNTSEAGRSKNRRVEMVLR